MKKIVQINTTANWGSTGRIAESIGQQIIDQGWKSYIAYGRNDNISSQSELIKIGTGFENIIHGIKTRLFDRHGLCSIKGTKMLVKKIERINPDIIHIHNIHGYYLNYEVLFNFLEKINIPVVWTLHDCWPFTGHCTHYTEIKCEKWKLSCNKCKQIHQYPCSWFIDRSKKNFITKKKCFLALKNIYLVPVSNWLANEVSKSFLNKYSIHPIYNGIDTKIFNIWPSVKSKYNIDNKFLILGVANVWDDRKGLKDMVKLSENLTNNYVIILVGLTDKQIKRLPEKILGIGKTNDLKSLAQLYSSADVYINTSVEETFGLTTVESLACGTPAIVYNSSACPEIISENTGIVVEPHNISALISAVKTIRKVGKSFYKQKCRERAVRYFDKDIRYKEYIQLYNKILN